MGKGDRRTKRGKLWRGTHGKLRSAAKEKLRAADGELKAPTKRAAV